jgi:hypothetical protein
MDVGDENLAIFQFLGLHQLFLFSNSFNFFDVDQVKIIHKYFSLI